MKSIYVVEDDANIREIEMFALKSGGYETAGFECAADLWKAIKERRPSLILLDIMLPDEDGIAVLKRLRTGRETKSLPIILVTAKTTEIDKVKGLDAGADDYITKPFGVMELLSRVKALLRRAEPDQEKERLVLSDIILSMADRTCQVAGEPVELTYKEFELLALLIRNTGIVLTREVLMDKVWGVDFIGGSRTVDVHIKTLRKKLGYGGRHIKTVRNVGYLADRGEAAEEGETAGAGEAAEVGESAGPGGSAGPGETAGAGEASEVGGAAGPGGSAGPGEMAGAVKTRGKAGTKGTGGMG